MRVTHRLTMTAVCPVDGQIDHYEVFVETNRVMLVEDILKACAKFSNVSAPQEVITIELADALKTKVRTVGYHSGVRTEVDA